MRNLALVCNAGFPDKLKTISYTAVLLAGAIAPKIFVAPYYVIVIHFVVPPFRLVFLFCLLMLGIWKNNLNPNEKMHLIVGGSGNGTGRIY